MSDTRPIKLIRMLRILIYVAVAMQITNFFLNLMVDGDIHLAINGEIWSRNIASFGDADQLFITALFGASTAVLVWGLSHIAMLCRLFEGGMIFSVDCISCFKKFAVALLWVAMIDSLTYPVLFHYLYQRGILPSLPEMDAHFWMSVTQIEVLMVGVLFVLIARIMEVGAGFQEELEYTV